MGDSGATASLKGLKYQAKASVWIALQWLADDVQGDLVVEPPSGEDLAIDPPDQPVGVAVTGGLQIQIKRNERGPWRHPELTAFMKTKDGSGARDRADRLLKNDPNLRYALVTDMQPMGVLRPLLMTSLLGDFNGCEIPASLKAVLPANAKGRVGIVVLDEIRAELEAKQWLGQRWSVPVQCLNACYQEFVDAVVARIEGIQPPIWPRADIVALLRRHEGAIAGGLAVECYVEPSNFKAIQAMLENRRAVLLLGTPGVGKSLTAEVLLYRWALHGYRRVRPGSVEEFRSHLAEAGPLAIHLDDPFGQFPSQSKGREAWDGALRDALERRNPDKLILICSRAAILSERWESDLPQKYLDIRVEVTEGSYTPSLRWWIVMKQLRYRQVSDDHLSVARRHKRDILKALQAPLALARFAQRLADREAPQTGDVRKLIETSTVEALTDEAVRAVKGWPNYSVACATVIWAHLVGRFPLSRSGLGEWRNILRHQLGMTLELREFSHFLEQDHFLELRDDLWHAHPKVIEGLQRVVAGKGEAEDVIRAMTEWWLDQGDTESARRLLGEAKAVLPDLLNLQLRQRLQPILVEAARTEASVNTLMDLRDMGLSDATTTRVSACLAGPESQWSFFPSVLPLPDELTALVAGDQDALSIIRTFVEQELSKRWGESSSSVRLFLDSLPMDTDAVVIDLALRGISDRDSNSGCWDELVYLAAKQGPAIRDRLLEAIAGEFVDAHGQMASDEDDFRKAEDGQYAAGFMHHLGDVEPPDAWPSACLTEVLRAEREDRGWRAVEGLAWNAPLQGDRARIGRDDVLNSWIEIVRDVEGSDFVRDEFAAQFVLASPQIKLGLTRRSGRKNHQDLVPVVEPYLLAALHDHDLVRVYCRIPEADLSAVFRTLDIIGQAELVSAMASEEGAALPVTGGLAALDRAARQKPLAAPLSPEIVAELQRIAREATVSTALDAFRALRAAGAGTLKLAQRLIDDDDPQITAGALTVLTPPRSDEEREVFRRMLTHPRAAVREAAADGLADFDDDRPSLFALVKDVSAHVRMCLVTLITSRSWREGVATLIDLLSDRRDYRADYYHSDEAPEHEVARKAAEGLALFHPLNDGELKRLVAFIQRGPVANSDPDVIIAVISVLAAYDMDGIVACLLAVPKAIPAKPNPERYIRVATVVAVKAIIDCFPHRIADIDLQWVRALVRDRDPRVRAQAIRLAAVIGGESISWMEGLPEDHRALFVAEVGSRVPTEAVAIAQSLLPPDHPLFQLLPGGKSDKPELSVWIDELEPDEGVSRELLDSLKSLISDGVNPP